MGTASDSHTPSPTDTAPARRHRSRTRLTIPAASRAITPSSHSTAAARSKNSPWVRPVASSTVGRAAPAPPETPEAAPSHAFTAGSTGAVAASTWGSTSTAPVPTAPVDSARS